jgi:hypothetical protein
MHIFAIFTDKGGLFKPRKEHRTQSSVYLVAKGVGLRRGGAEVEGEIEHGYFWGWWW